MNVTGLPVDPGPAGWNMLLPARRCAPALDKAITADWVVIGAGFAGLSAAARLAQLRPSDKIVVLEAKAVADGPAGRNSGFMIDLPHDLASENYGGALDRDRAQTQDNRRAIRFAASLAEEFGASENAFALSGKINGAASARGVAHNAEFARHLKALGEDFKVLDAADMRALTGTTYYQQGLLTPGTAMLQPALFVRQIVDGLRAKGVKLYEHSPVVDLSRRADWVAQTPAGKVTAPKVILAVNGHLQSFGHSAGRLMHVFTYASMTRALSQPEADRLGGAARWGLTPADPMGTTVRRIAGQGGDRIVVRNRFTFDPSMQVSDRRILQVAQDHRAAFSARFPMLQDVEMEHVWGGRLCLSLNNVQVIRELEDGLWSACCQNGLGTAKGTLAGLLAAEGAVGDTSPALERALAMQAPTQLPPAPIAKLGAAVRLRWGEWRAGREM